MSNITEQQIEDLKNAETEDARNKVCDKIVRAHNGQYPDDWYQRAILGGLLGGDTISISTVSTG